MSKKIKTKKSERYKEESEEEGSSSNNNDEYDEKEARIRLALAPCFPASNKQLTKWLGCLHKSRRSHQRLIDSETDEEDLTKSIIAIYDYSWRSDELKNLLRNVLDVHSSNKVKLIRERKYDDEVQKYDRPHPSNAPEWSYIVQQQDLIFDTDIDQGFNTKYDEEVEEVSRGTTPATGNTTKNDEDHNKKGEEKPSKSTVGDNHNNSDSDLHMDDAQ
ncbi:uncharacterized protein OCT59_020615 [Rhizophagus irregularis]|nr:hypothetical protein OCT59_020615 [Rhizophagus irregularis]